MLKHVVASGFNEKTSAKSKIKVNADKEAAKQVDSLWITVIDPRKEKLDGDVELKKLKKQSIE